MFVAWPLAFRLLRTDIDAQRGRTVEIRLTRFGSRRSGFGLRVVHVWPGSSRDRLDGLEALV